MMVPVFCAHMKVYKMTNYWSYIVIKKLQYEYFVCFIFKNMFRKM